MSKLDDANLTATCQTLIDTGDAAVRGRCLGKLLGHIKAIEADHDRVVAELTRVRDAWTDRARNSEARLAAIQIERDALAADARRYRWLRSADSGIDAIAHRTPISNTGATCVTLLEGEGLDTAIDAALTKAGFPTK